MAASTEVLACEKKHEILADFIKKVHGNLRKNVRKAYGDVQTVWREHCSDEALLQRYAEAMKELAVEHWGENNLRRIEWCLEICLEYFHGGGQEKCLRKDCRRILMNLDEHQNCGCVHEAETLEQTLTRGLVKENKLLLLDVGSCFNPFQAYPETFIPVAIDLFPADKTVFKCDFLHLDVCKQSDLCKTSCQHTSLPTPSRENCLYPNQIQTCVNGDEITQLPEASFNVIIFCLLLSYLPARTQRWACCVKAHGLLTDGGLLVIITPDSSHQNKNVKMIKSWKTAIESIGFARWKYLKDSHTHCMAFRKKTLCTNLAKEGVNSGLAEMLFIPQDLQDDFEEEEVHCARRTESDERNSSFSDLPFPSADI